MGVTFDRGGFYFVKRVPRRFAAVDPRSQVRVCLHTDSRREAVEKAHAVEAELVAYWEALAAGRGADAAARYDAARELSAARGFAYRPLGELLAAARVRELLDRVQGLASPAHVAPQVEVEAMLGLAPVPRTLLSEALAEFFELTTDRVRGKSEAQIYRWRLDRERAVANFIAAAKDKPVAEITREDMLAYRKAWADKLEKKKQNPESANKDFGHLADVIRTVSDIRGLGVDPALFAKLRFRKSKRPSKGVPFSTPWIRDTLLAEGALARLNEEARLPLLVMVNTGARPSEILGAARADWVLDAKVPHLAVRPRHDHELKTEQSEREIPLLGVSLEAARALAALPHPGRYFQKSGGWSAVVNKFLDVNKLRETPAHTAYSLRHAFEDRLLEAGVDHRLRVELMGHKYERPAYGRGGSLELKAKALELIAI